MIQWLCLGQQLRWGANSPKATSTFSCCFVKKELVVGERTDEKVMNLIDPTVGAHQALVFGRSLNRRDLIRIAGSVTGFALTQHFVDVVAAQDATPSAAGQLFNPS